MSSVDLQNQIKTLINKDKELKRKVIIQTSIALALFVIMVAVIGLFFRAEALVLTQTLFDSFGIWVLVVSFFLTSAVLLPLPDDLLAAMAVLIGFSFFEVVGLALLGSILGALFAYFLGKYLSQTIYYKTIIRGWDNQAKRLMKTYGDAGLAISAFSPSPFSIVCWVCGALDYNLTRFIIICTIFRTLRITLSTYLVVAGLNALDVYY